MLLIIIAGRNINRAYFGQGTVPVVWSGVNCNGMESKLFECSHDTPSSNNCGRNRVVSVQCILRDDQERKI